ncbi:MAG: DUF2339 domain-containing protein [Rhodomicrobiaceae bacterium]
MELAVILAVALLLAPYFFSGWALLRAGRLERAAEDWRRELDTLQTAATARDDEIASLRRQLRALQGLPTETDATFAEPAPAEAEAGAEPEMAGAEPASYQDRSTRDRGWRAWTKGGLERQFGAVLPVWIGGIAIAFAGFFLVKYSIENDLIGPQARVVLGGLLGFALLAAARWVSLRILRPDGHRIAQALAGAGLAVLYVSVYAATSLYQLVPPLFGFAGLAAITTLAVILALRHGPPVALLGMVGGFLTPALMASGEPSAFLFFSYLYFVFAAVMIVIRRKGWWILSFPAVLFAFGWVLTWIFSGTAANGQSVWLGVFLVAVAGTIVAATRGRYVEETQNIASWRDVFSWRNRALALNIVSLAGAMGLMALMAFDARFGLNDWVLFAVLAVGAVGLAFFDTPRYGFAPWAAMAINAVMLAGWMPGGERELAVALSAFGALYVTSGFLLVSSAVAPLLWAGLSAAAALGYYLIGFFRLTPLPPALPQPLAIDIPPSREPVEPLVEGVKQAAAAIPHIWAVLAMALSLLFFGAALWAARRLPPSLVKERVLAIYALATTAFLALTFFIELDREFLSVAIAAELLAVAWVATKTQISSLRPIAGLLGIAFAVLLFPQILLLVQLSLYSILGIEWHLQASIPIVDYPSFQLALPAGMFLLAAYTLRRAADGFLIRTLEFAAVALIALWGFYATAKLFHPGEDVLFAKASFFERGVITNVLFLFGLGCLVIGRLFGRIAFFQCGALLVAIALFRIFYFDLITRNPLWYGGEVAGVTFFDALTVTFGLPILWAWLASAEIGAAAKDRWLIALAKTGRALMLIFAFAWISLEVRKLYHGAVLAGPAPTDAEFYSYSAAWLVFALTLLFYGTLKGSQLLRYASLTVLLVTVSKVFLLDAGSLTGLYRVFSFLGLGLSLLAISYFYGRFVFGGRGSDPAGEAAASP